MNVYVYFNECQEEEQTQTFRIIQKYISLNQYNMTM